MLVLTLSLLAANDLPMIACVDRAVWLAAYLETKNSVRVQHTFQQESSDGGCVQLEGFVEALSKFRVPLSPEKCAMVFKHLDVDDTGWVDYVQFQHKNQVVNHSDIPELSTNTMQAARRASASIPQQAASMPQQAAGRASAKLAPKSVTPQASRRSSAVEPAPKPVTPRQARRRSSVLLKYCEHELVAPGSDSIQHETMLPPTSMLCRQTSMSEAAVVTPEALSASMSEASLVFSDRRNSQWSNCSNSVSCSH